MVSPPRTGFADMRSKPTRDSSGIEVPSSGMLSLQSLHEDTKNIRDFQILHNLPWAVDIVGYRVCDVGVCR